MRACVFFLGVGGGAEAVQSRASVGGGGGGARGGALEAAADPPVAWGAGFGRGWACPAFPASTSEGEACAPPGLPRAHFGDRRPRHVTNDPSLTCARAVPLRYASAPLRRRGGGGTPRDIPQNCRSVALNAMRHVSRGKEGPLLGPGPKMGLGGDSEF